MAGASRPADAPAVAATVRTTTWFAGTAAPGERGGVAPSTTPGGTSCCSSAAHRQAHRVRRGDRRDPARDVLRLLPGESRHRHGMSLRVTRCATTSRISVDFPAPGGESTTVTGCPDHTRYSARAVTDPTTIRGSVSSGSTTGPASGGGDARLQQVRVQVDVSQHAGDVCGLDAPEEHQPSVEAKVAAIRPYPVTFGWSFGGVEVHIQVSAQICATFAGSGEPGWGVKLFVWKAAATGATRNPFCK